MQKKNGLKEKIQTMVTELKNKTDAYSEVKDKPENEKEEGEEEVPRDEKMEELIDLFQKTDFNSDLEKITEVLDDRISKLRDQLETARSQSTENYFNNLNTNDYYRNKKRIDDIQQIYNIYWDKIQNVISEVNKPKNPEENK